MVQVIFKNTFLNHCFLLGQQIDELAGVQVLLFGKDAKDFELDNDGRLSAGQGNFILRTGLERGDAIQSNAAAADILADNRKTGAVAV